MPLAAAESSTIHDCAFGKISCPGPTNTSSWCPEHDNGPNYCACGYVGPRCSVCAVDYFLAPSKTGQQCALCDDGRNWYQVIIAGVTLLVCIVLVVVFCIKTGLRAFLMRYYEVGKTKCSTMVQAFQASTSSSFASFRLSKTFKCCCTANRRSFHNLLPYRKELVTGERTASLHRHLLASLLCVTSTLSLLCRLGAVDSTFIQHSHSRQQRSLSAQWRSYGSGRVLVQSTAVRHRKRPRRLRFCGSKWCSLPVSSHGC